MQVLEEELLDSMDVQESHIRDLKRELNRLETEHQSLKEPSRYLFTFESAVCLHQKMVSNFI